MEYNKMLSLSKGPKDPEIKYCQQRLLKYWWGAGHLITLTLGTQLLWPWALSYSDPGHSVTLTLCTQLLWRYRMVYIKVHINTNKPYTYIQT